MTHFTKARQEAEAAFSQLQTPFFAKDHAMDEQDFVAQAREAKTRRLREARLEKASDDRSRATLTLMKMRASV